MAISDITTTELASLLGRRTREGQLTAGESDTIFALFLKHRRSYEVVAVDDDAIYDAARLLLGRLATPLRALDALQLVSAERAFRSATDHGVAVGAFVSANHRLLQAAAALGLRAENPEDHA